jgi:hypothetical protein
MLLSLMWMLLCLAGAQSGVDTSPFGVIASQSGWMLLSLDCVLLCLGYMLLSLGFIILNLGKMLINMVWMLLCLGRCISAWADASQSGVDASLPGEALSLVYSQ